MTYELTAFIFKYDLLQAADVIYAFLAFSLEVLTRFLKLTKTYAAFLLRYIFSSEPYYLLSLAIILVRKGANSLKDSHIDVC